MKISILLLFLHFSLFALTQNKKVYSISEKILFSKYVGKKEGVFINKIWSSNKGKTDSVLWETPLQGGIYYFNKFHQKQIDSAYFINFLSSTGLDTNQIKCDRINSSLVIFEKIFQDSVYFNIRKKDNEYLKNDYQVSYSIAEIKKYENFKDVPDDLVKTIQINFEFCDRNISKACTLSLALIPFKGEVNYNDADLGDYYLMVSKRNHFEIEFNNIKIHLYQTKISPHYTNTNVGIKIERISGFDETKFENSVWYKNNYLFGDTIISKDSTLIIDSISLDGSKLFTRSWKKETPPNKKEFLPSSTIKSITPLFKNTTYMILDFWGTWCRPCLDALPKLQKIFKILPHNISIVSICYDKKENFKKSISIFK
jgi:hypothetical protein